MTDRPILFSAPMIRALLDGRKTMTRRVLKPAFGKACPIVNLKEHGGDDHIFHYSGRFNDPASWGYPFAEDGCDMPLKNWPETWGYAPGDRLWVREGVTRFDRGTCDQHIWYRAGQNEHYLNMTGSPDGEWPRGQDGPGTGPAYNVPSIHMPRWASRLTLIVESVKVERLQDISEEDAIAEGVVDTGRRDGAPYSHCIVPGMPEITMEHEPSTVFAKLWELINGDGSWRANPWCAAISFRVIKANIDSIGASHDEA